MEVASTASEFEYAVSRFKAYDLILVDTAGRNPGDSQVPSLLSFSAILRWKYISQ